MTDAVTPPTISTISEDEYRFEWSCGIQAVVDRIAEHSHELSANISITSTRPPSPGSIYPAARINLMSPQTRDRLATNCAKREPDLDWDAIIGQLCVRTQDRWRTGEPSIDMRQYEPSALGRWLLEPYIERADATVLFARGGTGKSLFATALAITVASGHEIVGRLHGSPEPVLYLDWETNSDTFSERLRAFCFGAAIPVPAVHYQRMVSSLPEAASTLAKEVRRLDVGLVIVDSRGMARGGEPESADLTIRTFKAGRQLGVPWVAVDHVTKASGDDAQEPFGSAYTRNAARLMWSLRKSNDQIALRLTKANNGREGSQAAYRTTVDVNAADRPVCIRYDPIDLAVSVFSDSLPLRQRILTTLVRGMTREELAEDLEADIKTVRARIVEMKKSGEVTEVDNLLWKPSINN